MTIQPFWICQCCEQWNPENYLSCSTCAGNEELVDQELELLYKIEICNLMLKWVPRIVKRIYKEILRAKYPEMQIHFEKVTDPDTRVATVDRVPFPIRRELEQEFESLGYRTSQKTDRKFTLAVPIGSIVLR